METTYQHLSPYTQQFFENLRNYLDKPLYFFGSVQRVDYFPGSDIDVDIFTENPKSTIMQLQHYLKVESTDFKKMVWKINATGRLVHGHKIMYKEPDHNLIAEFSIYDEKYKHDVLTEHTYKMVLPFYITVFLYILKFFYYQLHLLPDSYYITLKRFILNFMVNEKEEHFVVIDVKHKKTVNQ